MNVGAIAVFCVLIAIVPARSQSTHGLITGRVYNAVGGQPLRGVAVRYELRSREVRASVVNSGETRSDADGLYTLSLLSPGVYFLRVEREGYQPQELYELELNVASALQVDFPMTRVGETPNPKRTWSPSGSALVHTYAADVEGLRPAEVRVRAASSGTLQSSVSSVIDSYLVRHLPLAGRDVYAALVLLPNVTSSTGSGRGLGFSVSGQRPGTGNYLLDGIENNNSLVTGPLTTVSPESMQEYRVSTLNYSAEYGRTSGFVANAVTRSGESAFHGIGYYNAKNDVLNANLFTRNSQKLPRLDASEHQMGFQAGGPAWWRDVFWSSAVDLLRSRNHMPEIDFTVPAGGFLKSTDQELVRHLLGRFQVPGVPVGAGSPETATIRAAVPLSIDRVLMAQRIDYRRGPAQYSGRFSLSRVSRPDLVWNPYPDFVAGLTDAALSGVISVQTALSPAVLNVLRAGYGRSRLGWERPHPEIPFYGVAERTAAQGRLYLPGSQLMYDYQNTSPSWEIQDHALITRGRHIVAIGGGFLARWSSGVLTTGRDGAYFFSNSAAFRADTNSLLQVSVDRGTNGEPDYGRRYRSTSWIAFAQDTFRITRSLALNLGVRYEISGSPRNVGSAIDTTIGLRPGMAVWQSGSLFTRTDVRELYRTDYSNIAPRFGISYDLFGSGSSILRAAYGLFYDRPFDNLWQTVRINSLEIANFGGRGSANLPVREALRERVRSQGAEPYTFFDPSFRNGRVQTFSYGLQQRITSAWLVEITGAGSLSRGLVTTDVIGGGVQEPVSKAIYDVQYRAAQGSSSYHAGSVVARYSSRRASLQAGYTLSHVIDNQSEPFGLDTFNLDFTRIAGEGNADRPQIATFAKPHDSRADRGNADFDQRHNLVLLSVWDLPAPRQESWTRRLLADWRLAQVASLRSGTPFTVFANSVTNDRAGIVDPSRIHISSDVPQGKRLLNHDAFCAPRRCGSAQISGRNALTGPGFGALDASISRSFPLAIGGEAGRITFRADVFNILNHVNLGNPNATFSLEDEFGVATYGRADKRAGFPSVVPLSETPRQVQLMLRVEW